MSTLTLRAVKGEELTHNELDQNFSNLNTDKLEKSLFGSNHVVLIKNGSGEVVEVVVSEQQVLGRLTGGQIKGLTTTELKALVGVNASIVEIGALSPADWDILLRVGGHWVNANMSTLKSTLQLKFSELYVRPRLAGQFGGGAGTPIYTADTWTEANVGSSDVVVLQDWLHDVLGEFTFNHADSQYVELNWSAYASVGGAFDTKKIAAQWRIFDDEGSFQYAIGETSVTIDPIGSAAGIGMLSGCGVKAFATGWKMKLYVKNLVNADDITLTDINFYAKVF
ncbi:MAG: hypothetical protein GC192_23520 [Bacteroidetes bacterium]|nr:hypothetical protein [Bacteroidota bacterium]